MMTDLMILQSWILILSGLLSTSLSLFLLVMVFMSHHRLRKSIHPQTQQEKQEASRYKLNPSQCESKTSKEE